MLVIVIIILILLLVYMLFFSDGGGYGGKTAVSREKTILEDILKKIYVTKEHGNSTRLSVFVKSLEFSEQKVVKVLRKMEQIGLVGLLDDEVRLTNDGEEYALRIIKAHRLWERYLAEKTGHDKHKWHSLAERAEHKLTEEEVGQLAKELKRPLFDPHGSPIPYDKNMPKAVGKPITSYPVGTVGRIVHINDEPEEFYKQIVEARIHIGAQVKITSLSKGKAEFESEGQLHSIDLFLATGLAIVPLAEDEIIDAKITRLSDLRMGEQAEIVGISTECRGEVRRRLLDLGFVKKSQISIGNISPMGDPVAYCLHNTLIALRGEHSQFILVEKKEANG